MNLSAILWILVVAVLLLVVIGLAVATPPPLAVLRIFASGCATR